MTYVYTLLKPLPDYPINTKFYSFEEPKPKSMFSTYVGLDRKSRAYPFPKGITEELLNNSEWFKKEIDYEDLKDLSCPICGETRGVVSMDNHIKGDKYDGYRIETNIYFEYCCGHSIRKLF